jgi:bifunctional ADP-heptose synthase (sugar kinase/adenylyltransferase)
VDTRSKILSIDQARQIQGAVIVSGYFDPMTREHAERLAQLKQPGRPLLVLIATPPRPILPAEARAILVAGLRTVDYVALTDPTLEPHVRLESEDAARLAALIQHVRARQQAAS